MSMTFAEARRIHLQSLDAIYQRVRRLAADPKWRNITCRELNEATEEFNNRLKAICDLNNADLTGEE